MLRLWLGHRRTSGKRHVDFPSRSLRICANRHTQNDAPPPPPPQQRPTTTSVLHVDVGCGARCRCLRAYARAHSAPTKTIRQPGAPTHVRTTRQTPPPPTLRMLVRCNSFVFCSSDFSLLLVGAAASATVRSRSAARCRPSELFAVARRSSDLLCEGSKRRALSQSERAFKYLEVLFWHTCT